MIKKLNALIGEVKAYFSFLFDRGYQIEKAEIMPMDSWQVMLSSGNVRIVIYQDRGDIGLIFSPVSSNMRFRAGLEGMIYFLTHDSSYLPIPGRTYSNRKKEFERLSNLLKEYLDQIVPYFGLDYARYEPEIRMQQDHVLKAFLDKLAARNKRSGWQ